MIIQKILFLIVVLFIADSASFAISSNSLPVKSSVIPEKREFPVNEDINPCVDFYQYACSKVNDSFILREDRSRHIFSFNDASERILEAKKKYFIGLAKKNPKSTIEREVKNYYLACMNPNARKKEELAKVLEVKKLLEKINTREEFAALIAKNITNAYFLSFLSFSPAPNLDHPNHMDLAFEINLMSLPEKSYYENKELTDDLKDLIKHFFVAIGEKYPDEKAKLVFNFEKGLAKVYPTPPEIQERLNSRNKISKETLINNYPNLKLQAFLNNLPKHVVHRDIIGSDAMKYLNNKLGTASLEELKSLYLYFQLSSIMDDAYPEFFDKKFKFANKYLGGPDKRPKRQERCTTRVMSSFNKEIDSLLLPHLFPNFPKEKFIKSIEKIRVSLIKQLENNTWLSKETKQEAIRKIKTAKLALVSPDNEEEWDFNPRGYYKADTPITNMCKLGQLLIEKSLKELKDPVNTNRWLMGPLTVNANYMPNYNRFEFPVGILQYPFYDPNESEEVNLGAIGAVIGHELGHAIDNHGNRYNADGVFTTWMSDADKEIFKQKSQHLVIQFNKIGHNGEFTLGENIGDLVGLTTAYQAAFLDKDRDEQDLKELKKKFFLQFARSWCGIEREGITKMRLKTDPHSLEYARVNEQMKHQPGFKEAYGCKPGDPLVVPQEDVVRIW